MSFRKIISQEEIIEFWPIIWDSVKELLADYPHYYSEDASELLEALIKGNYELFAEQTSKGNTLFAITCLAPLRRGTAFRVQFVGGEISQEFSAAVTWLEQQARLRKASVIEFWGRRGWSPYLKPAGYKPAQINYTKVL